MLALLKWQALPARQGQLCANRKGLVNKQEELLKFKTIYAYLRVSTRAELAGCVSGLG